MMNDELCTHCLEEVPCVDEYDRCRQCVREGHQPVSHMDCLACQDGYYRSMARLRDKIDARETEQAAKEATR